MVTQILMIRVCETVANLELRISNYTSLTSNGVKQVERIRNRLKSFNISSIYSSAAKSARQTAEIIAYPISLIVTESPQFNEMDLGSWDGMKKTDIAFKYEKEWKE